MPIHGPFGKPTGGLTTPGLNGQGWVDYNDAATAISPISMTVADTYYPLTNDGAGPNSNNFGAIPGHVDMWDVSLNQFDFSSLKLGDRVEYRLDTVFTAPGVNTEVELGLELGVGGASYIIPIAHAAYKTTTAKSLGQAGFFYMGDNNTLLNTGRFLVRADSAGGSIVNNGFVLATIVY